MCYVIMIFNNKVLNINISFYVKHAFLGFGVLRYIGDDNSICNLAIDHDVGSSKNKGKLLFLIVESIVCLKCGMPFLAKTCMLPWANYRHDDV